MAELTSKRQRRRYDNATVGPLLPGVNDHTCLACTNEPTCPVKSSAVPFTALWEITEQQREAKDKEEREQKKAKGEFQWFFKIPA